MGMAQSSRRPSTRCLTRSLKVNLPTPWDVKTAYILLALTSVYVDFIGVCSQEPRALAVEARDPEVTRRARPDGPELSRKRGVKHVNDGAKGRARQSNAAGLERNRSTRSANSNRNRSLVGALISTKKMRHHRRAAADIGLLQLEVHHVRIHVVPGASFGRRRPQCVSEAATRSGPALSSPSRRAGTPLPPCPPRRSTFERPI
jgi:hypothetical protein